MPETTSRPSNDTVIDRWHHLGIEPELFEVDDKGTLQSQLYRSGRAGDTLVEALAPFEKARLALKGELKLGPELGRGGLGVVRSAMQRSLGREVAVKQCLTESQAEYYRLVREARILAALDHPAIIPIHMIGVDEEDRPLLVMKRVDGTSWGSYVDAQGGLSCPDDEDPLEWHLRVLMQVCQVAQYAHAYGLIHRDFKLENVVIGQLGEVYVADWDLALATDPTLPLDIPLAVNETEVLGTPEYMAPEMVMIEAERFGPRTDIYLLGACLHHILTGAPRHDGDSVIAKLYSAAQSAPFEYKESVPAELASIANRAMDFDPAARYPSADSLRLALIRFLKHRGSLRLSDAAMHLMPELEAMQASPTEQDNHAQLRRIGECRFGFNQALAQWPDNPQAREGLQHVQLIEIDHELTQGNHARAEFLIDEHGDVPIEILARLDQLKASASDMSSTHLAAQRLTTEGLQIEGELKPQRPTSTGTIRSRDPHPELPKLIGQIALLWVIAFGGAAIMRTSGLVVDGKLLIGVSSAMHGLTVALMTILYGDRLQDSVHGRRYSIQLALLGFPPLLFVPLVSVVDLSANAMTSGVMGLLGVASLYTALKVSPAGLLSACAFGIAALAALDGSITANVVTAGCSALGFGLLSRGWC